MWALKLPRTSADKSAAARNQRGIVRRISAAAGAIAVLSVGSTSFGQQSLPPAQLINRSTVPASSLGDALGHRLQQFRNAGTQLSDVGSPHLDRSKALQTSEDRPEETEIENPDVVPETTISESSPTIEEAPVVPALFLDLTQEERTESADSATERRDRRNPEITAGSNPTHALMRAVAWIVIGLCIFSLAILGLRHWQRQRGLLPTTNSRSRVLETLSLGPGRTVSLIELAGFRALVASDAGGIRSLVLAPMSFPDELLDAGQAPDPQSSKSIV